jgi:transaldolase
VKIPVINTQGVSTAPIIHSLSAAGVKLNITAIFTLEQVAEVAEALAPTTPAVVSVFAGRLADTGIDPLPIMRASLALLAGKPQAKLLWAATREVFNLIQADQMECPIITVPNDILGKLTNLGRSPMESSLDTVRTFLKDTQAAGFTIPS